MLSATSLVFLGVFIILYFAFRPKKRGINLPGPKGLPFLGNSLQLGNVMWQTFNKWSKEYGPMCKIQLGSNMTIVLVSDAKITKEMLALDAFAGRVVLDEFLLFEGKRLGLITSEGRLWEEQRRFVVRQLRDFGFGKSSMEPIIMEEVNELVNRISKLDGRPITDFKNELRLAVTNSLWCFLAGARFNQEDPKLRELQRLLQGAFDDLARNGGLGLMIAAPWLKYIIPEWSGYNSIRKAKNSGAEFIRKAVMEHKRTMQEGSPRDLIDVYLTEIKKTTDPTSSFYGEEAELQLINVVEDFFEAGTETTATTIDWAILHLLMEPRIQEKLQEEIDSVTGSSRQVSFSDRPNMPYTQAVMNELLRISIAPFGVPHGVLHDIEFKGVFFPKGTSIMINLHHIHHDPKIWDEPEAFKPERWLTEDGKGVKKNENLLAFLVGKRACPGETIAKDSVFLFLTNLVQRFDIVKDPNGPEPDLSPAVSFGVEARPYNVIFSERNKLEE